MRAIVGMICWVGLALPALADQVQASPKMDFVTDLALCPLSLMERHERGMSFDGTSFVEIEYHCEIERPLTNPDWGRDTTTTRVGYCAEPGAVFPTLFVLRWFASDPGQLEVFEGDGGNPTLYHLCAP